MRPAPSLPAACLLAALFIGFPLAPAAAAGPLQFGAGLLQQLDRMPVLAGWNSAGLFLLPVSFSGASRHYRLRLLLVAPDTSAAR